MAIVLLFQGDLPAARRHVERGIDVYDSELHHVSTVSTFGLDLGIAAHGVASLALWLLGYPAQAVERSGAGLTLAQELAHPHSLAWILNFSAVVDRWRRELQTARERAEAAVTLSDEVGVMILGAFGTITQSAAVVGLGHHETQVRQAGDAVAIVLGSQEAWMPYYLATMSEIQYGAGQATEALNRLDEGLEMSTRRGERFYEAELHRLKGEMTLQSAGEQPVAAVQQGAETCYEKALEIAREQSAKSLELRAATSLARLRRQQGKQAEARELLSGIYNWFTEGFDTKDLKDAKALLEELR
jgi:adenylate cyclase